MSERPRLLDLFCGAGGATRGYQLAGFHVTGVDIKPQPRYVGEVFHHGDALEYLRRHGHEFDVIHASPPCQRYSVVTGTAAARERHPDLVAVTRTLLRASGKPWVIENVPGAPLLSPVRLCGSSFCLRVRRHRLFEANVPLDGKPCDHAWQDGSPLYPIYEHGRWIVSGVARVYGHGGGKAKDHWSAAMGIDWMTRGELAQAIPPAYTEYIGCQLRAHVLELSGR